MFLHVVLLLLLLLLLLLSAVVHLGILRAPPLFLVPARDIAPARLRVFGCALARGALQRREPALVAS